MYLQQPQLCFVSDVLNKPFQNRPNKIPPVFQSLGGSLIVSGGQSIFQNKLILALPRTNPNLSPGLVAAIGATEIRTALPAAEIPGVLSAYMEGIHSGFILAIPVAGVAFLISFTIRWIRLHKPDPKLKRAEESSNHA